MISCQNQTNNSLCIENEKLAEKNTTKDVKIEQLLKENAELKSNIKELKAEKFDKLLKEYDQLKENCEKVSKTNEELTTENKTLTNKNTELDSKITEMEVSDTSNIYFDYENSSAEVKEEIKEEVNDEIIPKSEFDSDENVTIKD